LEERLTGEFSSSLVSLRKKIRRGIMKKFFIILVALALITCSRETTEKELEIQGTNLISRKPPFTVTLPSEFDLVHSSSHENPEESSLTRVYFLVKTKGKKVEEMLILQIADKTNPQAGPMTAAPLKPYTEKRLYSKKRIIKGKLEVDYLIQLMAWNPDAPSLQPILKKGLVISSHWALQGQFLFLYQGEGAVSVRYSKDANSFGIRVSDGGREWEKGSISGNEKRVCEVFQKTFLQIIDTIHIITP
jgi:hypothetical protein